MRLRTRPLCLAGFAALALALVPAYLRADVESKAPDEKGQKEVSDKIAEGDKKLEEVRADKKDAEAEKDPKKKAEKEKKWAEDSEAFLKLRQEAIDLADKNWGLEHPKGLNSGPTYDPFGTPGEGKTTPKGDVTIGEGAFHDEKGNPHPGWLASSKAHEFVHVGQLGSGTWTPDAPENMPDDWYAQMMETLEVAAYDWEIAHADDNKLTDAQKAELKKRRDDHFKKLKKDNQDKVKGGDLSTTCAPVESKAGGAAAPPGQKEPVHDVDELGTPGPGSDLAPKFMGNGTTHSVSMWAANGTGHTVAVRIPAGVVLVPNVPGEQPMMVPSAPDVHVPDGGGWASVPAICLDQGLKPPSAGTELRPVFAGGAPSAAQIPGVPDAATQAAIHDALLSAQEVLQEFHGFQPSGSTALGDELVPMVSTRILAPEGFLVPAPGPFEQSHPASTDAPPRGRLDSAAPGGTSAPLVPSPTQAGGPQSAAPAAPASTFDTTVLVQTSWAIANNQGKPNRDKIVSEMTDQVSKQGVAPETAAKVANLIADEVVPVVQQALDRAKANKDAKIDWKALDLTLKGARPK